MKTGVSVQDLFDADFCQMKLGENFRQHICIEQKDGKLILTSE